MKRSTQYGLAATMILVGLAGCAPIMEALVPGSGAPVQHAAAATAGAVQPDIVDTGLGFVENSAYALGGVGAIIGMGVGFIRRRRRLARLNASIGTGKDTADSPSKGLGSTSGPITLNINCGCSERAANEKE